MMKRIHVLSTLLPAALAAVSAAAGRTKRQSFTTVFAPRSRQVPELPMRQWKADFEMYGLAMTRAAVVGNARRAQLVVAVRTDVN